MICAMLVVLAMMRTKRLPVVRDELPARTGETPA
jgi:hypothetical protein